MFRKESANTINKEILHLPRSLFLTFLITNNTRSTMITDLTATLIDHILTNSREKISQSDVKS